MREARCYITLDDDGTVFVLLLEDQEDDQVRYVDSEVFGPFDVAQDASRWLCRRLRDLKFFPMR